MECIQGLTWKSALQNLTVGQKEAISNNLRKQLMVMRNMPSPGYYGSTGRQPVLDNLFWTGTGSTGLGLDGLFSTEEELNSALVQICLSHDHPPPAKAEFYRTTWKAVLKDHPSVFTHGDLQRKNIIIRPCSDDHEVAENWAVTIIDWETA